MGDFNLFIAILKPMAKYYVYVGQLSKEFANTRKAKRKNIDADLNKSCLYVGHSNKEPRERWKQHLERARNNKGRLFSPVAAKWGENYIHWRKFNHYNPINSRQEAEKLEEKIAIKYRDKGFTVWSDKLPLVDK